MCIRDSIDPFCFDEFGMIDRGVKAIRFLYGVTGVVGLIGGGEALDHLASTGNELDGLARCV